MDQWIRLMDYQRHEWMNDLQVLFGYVRLKKFDKLPDVVEKLKHKASQESKMTKLGVPELVKELLLFRMNCQTLDLFVESEGQLNISGLMIDAASLTRTIMTALECFGAAARMAEEGKPQLQLQFVDKPEEGFEIRFQYSGDYHLPTLHDGLGDSLRVFESERGGYFKLDYRDVSVDVVVGALSAV
nr:Spo0B domain-containing protein [Paenibacillus turpanensis]